MIEVESEASRRMDGLEIVRDKQLFYSDRVQTNGILSDWWWNKMELEAQSEMNTYTTKCTSNRLEGVVGKDGG